MCGIFGISYHDGATVPDLERLRSSARWMRERGPDSTGIHRGPGIGLAATRLALVDPTVRSDQPFWDSTRRYCMVFNGEIYNYQELRTPLEQRGLRMCSKGDTEVLLESVVSFGLETVLPKLEGMFAFAIVDTLDHSISLARDRFGFKPLYVCAERNHFSFASSLRAFRPWKTLEPDGPAVAHYIKGFSGPTRGQSLFKDISIVPPGGVVRVTKDGLVRSDKVLSTTDLWHRGTRENLNGLDFNQTVNLVDRQLQASVHQQLNADTPLGALCSGGVDSSLIAAVAAKACGQKLTLFHADVVGECSEYEHAAAVARYLGLPLQRVGVVHKDFVDAMPRVISYYGQPFDYHANSIPFYRVSQLISRHGFKGVLSGEGADECFLGYERCVPDLRPLLTGGLQQRGRHVPAVWRDFVRLSGAKRFRLPSAEITEGRTELDLDEIELAESVVRSEVHRVKDRDLEPLRLMGYHLRTILHRNDALGMAAGVEARFPYLNTALTRTSVNLNYRKKIRFSLSGRDPFRPLFENKRVLRKVAERYLPHEFSHRPKLGFPADAYRKMEISRDLLRSSFVVDFLELSPSDADQLIERSSQWNRLRMLHLEVWKQVFVDDRDPDETAQWLHHHVSLPG